MTSDKVERVARAILDEMDITDGLDAESAERDAAAAIAACEAEAGEPTEAMIEAGRRELSMVACEDEMMGDGEIAERIYTAMRRAALNTAGEGATHDA
jgi:hypothetical protein